MFVEHCSFWLAAEAQQECLQVAAVLSPLLVVVDSEHECRELGENGDQPLPPMAADVCARHLCFAYNGY